MCISRDDREIWTAAYTRWQVSSAVEVFSVAAAFFLVQCGSIKIFDIEEINK